MTFSSETDRSEVRIMPMSMAEEFPDEERLRYFFLTELPNGNTPDMPTFRADRPERKRGQYFYRESGLSAPRDALLLFQWNAQIVAQATLVTVKPLSGGGKYHGSYFLFPSTIRLIEPFVTQAEFESIWPGKYFSNAKHKLALRGLPSWSRLVAPRLVAGDPA